MRNLIRTVLRLLGARHRPILVLDRRDLDPEGIIDQLLSRND